MRSTNRNSASIYRANKPSVNILSPITTTDFSVSMEIFSMILGFGFLYRLLTQLTPNCSAIDSPRSIFLEFVTKKTMWFSFIKETVSTKSLGTTSSPSANKVPSISSRIVLGAFIKSGILENSTRFIRLHYTNATILGKQHKNNKLFKKRLPKPNSCAKLE